ncbi:MAG TPA: hypothetical protein VK173_07050, partial [Lacibacter sp.]|nr:hypothetical protein [Lacibacter sp.]
MKLGQFIFTCLLLTAFFIPYKSEGQTISGVINSYHKATAIINNGTYNSYSYSGITLQDITGLSTGDRVLIIQMKGASITSTDNSSFGNISSIGNAGKYEFSSICGFLNNTIVLSNHLLHTYDVSMVQVVRVPVYNQDINVNGTLSPTPWNSSTGLGGVLAFEVNGTLTLNANISANGAGFSGGGLFVNTTNRCGPETNYYYSLAQSSGSNLGGSPKGEGVADFVVNREYGRGKQSNGGGGANVDNTGGGGGSNYGVGGNGGYKSNTTFCNATTVGIGGTTLSSFGYPASVTSTSTTNKIFLGGGGGTGEMNNIYSGTTGAGTPGGNGGGITFIKATTLVGNGFSISSNGAQGVNPVLPVPTEAAGDGGGGGGAGGVVLLDVTTFSGNVTVQARGANGSNAGFQAQCPGPGGGGGGGVIWYNGVLPGTVTTSVAGGTSGLIKDAPAHNPPCEGTPNNATDGTSGLLQSGFVAPQGNNTIDCSILPVDLLKQFTGKRNSTNVQLNWELRNKEAVQKIVLERRTGNEAFISVYEQLDPTTINGFYVDQKNNSNVTYRLVVYALNGERQYSNHVFFEADERKTFHLYPNPANDDVT